MADSLLRRGHMMSIPNETLCHIITYLDEPDLFALSLVNRRLNTVAGPALRNGLYNDSLRSKEVLLWAVEDGRHQLLQHMLERGVTPDFLYLSSLLRSRLLDVFASQGRRGTAGPRKDRTLRKELFREKYCRSAQMRKRVRYFVNSVRNKVPMEQDLDYYFDANLGYEGHPYVDKFGVVEDLGASETVNYWAWGPIHVSVLLHNNTALQLLLEHGADVNAQCSGLCDCAAPDLTGEDDPNRSVTPHKARSVWSPLHIAMCSNNEEAVRLLLSRGSSTFVGNLLAQPYHLKRNTRLTITALQDAAWLRSSRMCCLLLESSRFRKAIDHVNRRKEGALNFAAVSGSIQTVGRLLLENGAKFHHYEDRGAAIRAFKLHNDPVRQLCMQFRYGEARWLFHFVRRLHSDKTVSTLHFFTRILAALCVLRAPAVYSRLSLREQQDRLYRLSSGSEDRCHQQDIDASRDSRLAFAKELLDLGADPNRGELADHWDMPVSSPQGVRWERRMTALQLASRSGFTEMISLLLSRGANCNLMADMSDNPRQLPLLLAITDSLTRGKNEIAGIQALLNAGASLEDHRGRSVLLSLHQLGYFRRDSDTVQEGWLRIANILLTRGAASRARDWEAVVESACVPGNLKYCEMLGAWRSIEGLPWETLARMLEKVTACDHTAKKEDPEMITWVLSLCRKAGTLDKETRLKLQGSVKRRLRELPRGKKAREILEGFLAKPRSETGSSA